PAATDSKYSGGAGGLARQGQGQGLSLLHELRAHKNRNWPIKAAVFRGRSFDPSAAAAALRSGSGSASGRVSAPPSNRGPTAADAKSNVGAAGENWYDRTALVATGSSDQFAFVFDIGTVTGSGPVAAAASAAPMAAAAAGPASAVGPSGARLL